MAKDQAAEREQYAKVAEAQREIAQAFDLQPLPAPPMPAPAPLPARDPLEQAREVLWDEFTSAEPAEQLALFQQALGAGQALDSEYAFEMICTFRDNHDRAVFAQALDMLREQRPELYEHDAPYYLDWCIGDALAAGNRSALPELSSAFAATAGKDLDIFYLGLDKLAYHGELALAARMMALAWSHLGENQDLVPWAPEQFVHHAINLTLLAHVEQHPGLRPDDPDLLAALAVFAPVSLEQFAQPLALLSGQVQRRWALEDFAFRQRARRKRHERQEWYEWLDEEQKDDDQDAGDPPDPVVRQLYDLSLVFLGELGREEHVSLAKGDLARRSIARYVLDRHAGKLEPQDGTLAFLPRPKGQKKQRKPRVAPPHPLCPDRETFDRFLAGMLNFVSPQYYEAIVTLELMPAWLRFLERQGLLTAEQHAQALNDLRRLVSDLAPIWEQRGADPAVGPNVQLAWEQA
jgi:hypothetical protein